MRLLGLVLLVFFLPPLMSCKNLWCTPKATPRVEKNSALFERLEREQKIRMDRQRLASAPDNRWVTVPQTTPEVDPTKPVTRVPNPSYWEVGGTFQLPDQPVRDEFRNVGASVTWYKHNGNIVYVLYSVDPDIFSSYRPVSISVVKE